MKKRLTMILACLFLFAGMALAQTAVTGTVVSADDGQPVIGASVKVVGSKGGTVTNVDGEFTIIAPEGARLEVSYVGMKPVTVKAGKNMKVVLATDDNLLENVVVTGYGSARKLGTIAGSVSTVSSKDIANRPIANVGDAMQGQVAGLQVFTSSGEPSATTSMRIRGVTSINASTQPLFILDGSEISQNTFLSLNPNDIESMTVLKDASSTAIYGSRAANGVVVMTTKKGKFGEAPTVTISAQYGISKMTGDNADMMDANQWLDFQEILTPSLANNANFQAKKDYYRKYNIGTDWNDILFGGSKPTWQVDASVRGGGQNVSYLLSFGHYEASGIIDDSSMRRESIRANIEANINNWIKIGANTNLAYTKYRETLWGDRANSVYNKSFAARTYNPTQTYYEVLGLDPTDYANSTFEGYGKRLDYLDDCGCYNPYYIAEWQPRMSNRVRLNENMFINLNPIKGLNIRTAVGLDANDLRNSYQWTITEDPNVNPTASARETFSRFYRWTVTNTVEYKFDLFKKHHFTVLAGQESMTAKTHSFGAMVNGLTDNRLLLMSAGSDADIPNHSKDDEVRNSWFGMLNYEYDNRYFVDLSIRRDGSSLFGKNNRWGTFGAAAFMWNVTGEKFMQSTRSWLDELHAKISYGTTGNSGITQYLALGLVGSGPIYGPLGSGTAISNPANPDLTWETVKTFNVGISGKVFKRVTFDVEFYNKVTSDMLMSMPYSYTTGFSSGWGNVAEMYNRGLDFEVGVDIIKNKDWYWNVKVNGNYNKNKITKLLNDADSYTTSGGIRLEVGHSYGDFYGVMWSHVDPRDGQNVWIDINGNETKIASDANMVMQRKSFIAPWSGGLMTTVAWKGLQLDVQFSGMFGRYLFNNERWFTENPTFATKNNQSTAMFSMWQKPGDITDIAAADATYYFGDDRLLENASFVRLKFLQLSYTLPKKIMEKTRYIKGAKVFFVGRNLLTFTGYKGYDPEVDSDHTLGNYPNTLQISFGAELTF